MKWWAVAALRGGRVIRLIYAEAETEAEAFELARREMPKADAYEIREVPDGQS